MKVILLSVLLIIAGCRSPAERDAAPDVLDEAALIRQLEATTVDWNRGDLEGFIAPYDSTLTFMTRNGPINRDQLQERYRQTYFTGDQPVQMLRFEQIEVRALGSDHALMTGRYVLTGGDAPEQSGWFSLVWARSEEGWRIVHDHSS